MHILQNKGIVHQEVFLSEKVKKCNTSMCNLALEGTPVDTDVDGRIILRWIFRKWEGVVENGWSGLRIGTGGGHL
jgi:hypothetical protein